MASFCHFFHMQPSEFWRLSLREHQALVRYTQDYAKEMKRASQ